MTGRFPLVAVAALAAGALLTAGCTGDAKPQPGSAPRTAAAPAGGFRLVAFNTCQDALRDLKQAAKAYVGPYGFTGGVSGERLAAPAEQMPKAAKADARAMDAAAPGAANAGAPGSGYSGTNTHEAGVDEPDLVKTDGRRIVTVAGGVLRVVDPATRKVTGRLDLATASQDPIRGGADLLLSGDHALVLDRYPAYSVDVPGGGPQPAGGALPGGGMDVQGKPAVPPTDPRSIAGSRLLLVDLSGAPRLLSAYTMDGSLVDARQVGGTARIVFRSSPRLLFPYSDRGTDEERLAANKAVIDAAGADGWLPRYAVTTDGRTEQGRVECGAVNRPAKYTGTSMVTVLTFDLGASKLGSGDPVTVVADGDTVYSNGPSLYVANDQSWLAMRMPEQGRTNRAQPPKPVTEIYKFDTSGSDRPRYLAAGSVPGNLINQYALSEWDGHLRVATTQGQLGTRAGTDSTVYVLRQDGASLVQTGKVGGLGKGERIYAVRFVGPVGYVVTFRQTDPLYTVDLTDPARPEVAGELKITGYSAYLHPAGEGRLIGIGQEASEQGRVQGTQVSLFDVADLNHPDRLAQYHVKYGHSEAEYDPHAFLYWPADRLLVVPLNIYQPIKAAQSGSALVLRVDDNRLTEVGTISQQASPQAGDGPIRRALVVDSVLWTVSDHGLQATSMSNLDKLAWIPLN